MNFIVQTTMGTRGVILLSAPTAQLTSRMKTFYGRCVDGSDTCHAAYGLHLDEAYFAGTSFYALEAVDELSHLYGFFF